MANTDNPNGFRPVGTFSGSPWQDSVQRFEVDASHAVLGVGDLVQMTSDGYLDVYAAGEISLLGVVVAVDTVANAAVAGKIGEHFLSTTTPTLAGYASNALAANTAGVVYVCTAPDVIMEAQEDAVSGAIALADVGANIEITNADPNTTTGISTMELDSDSVAQTATLPLKILGLLQRPDNELGATGSPGARWLVTPTVTHYYRAALGL